MKQQRTESDLAGGLLPALITIFSLVVLVGGVAGGLVTLAVAAGGEAGLGWADVQAVGVWLLAAVVAWLGLWSVAVMIARQGRIHDALERLVDLSAEPPQSRGDSPSAGVYEPHRPNASGLSETSQADWQLLLSQLRELNTNVLLSDAQRQAKQRRQVESGRRRLNAQIEQALAGGRFADADRALAKLSEMGIDDKELQPLEQRVAEARAAAESEDVKQVTARVAELLALAAFDKAEQAVGELLTTHPQSVEASGLLARVQREAKAFAHTQRHELYGQVQSFANQRQWRQALSAARQLLERFGDSAEGEALQAQMPTLRDNARIEEVRLLRDRIRELIGRKEFADAGELAEEVIRRFPETAAAEELRGQLARLRERAAEAGRNGAQA